MALFNEYQREENLAEPLVLTSSHSPKNPNSIVNTKSSTFELPIRIIRLNYGPCARWAEPNYPNVSNLPFRHCNWNGCDQFDLYVQMCKEHSTSTRTFEHSFLRNMAKCKGDNI